MNLDKGHSGNFVLDNEENNNLDSDASNDSIQTLSEGSSSSSYDIDDIDNEDDEELFHSNNAHTSGSTESILLSASEEEDEVVKAIIRSKDINTNHPPPIKTEDHVVDICFHPNSNMMAVADIAGDVYLFKYNNTETDLISTLELHLKACRDIEFNDSGTTLFSTAKDLCVMLTDLETEKLIRLYENAHEKPIYTMTVIGEHMFATGDDDGVVKMWDLRQRENKPIFSLKKMEDYVSAIVTNKEGKYLVCASGDGCLTTFNIPGKKLHVQSEEYQEELTCLGLFKYETKILVGTGKGKMYVYNWGEFGLHSDEFPNLTKKAINCMIPITENVVITGGEDGILRATSLFPHHHLGIVGEHSLSIEALDVNSDGTLIASSSHDYDIKFWNVQYFETLDVSKRVKGGKQRQLKHNLPSSKIDNASTFFLDLQ
ncbi:WD repeat-containing protein 55 homolog [Bombus vancouverensis nearcticus]|uniref:WD repeat-containing protein 55 homolog n=1 Tax=Bombus bifarius TaxID=103933 RepID=A0A6P8NLS3_9HYME|nr:WD repeat-containing protein 55 homolog [Bombus vancouverensis nearcticus]XP_033315410.1 WD repeat-containing protein 55 homolog [Bombus bifarius]